MNALTLLDGLGGPLIAGTALRFGVGTFFAISGYHKLTNKARHATFVATLKSCGVPHIRVMQWFVPSVELTGGLGVAFGALAPLAALGLLAIMGVALLTDCRRRVNAYKPIDGADRLDDWLYLPEMLYTLVLLTVIAGGAGALSIDAILKGVL